MTKKPKFSTELVVAHKDKKTPKNLNLAQN
ncbi:hypothetical protein H500_06135 [Helicobacter pylori CG-IMSS-2012]|nr:hypothetical protein H500_06135 [Helicobacter pylori CG-IMSS-2012]